MVQKCRLQSWFCHMGCVTFMCADFSFLFKKIKRLCDMNPKVLQLYWLCALISLLTSYCFCRLFTLYTVLFFQQVFMEWPLHFRQIAGRQNTDIEKNMVLIHTNLAVQWARKAFNKYSRALYQMMILKRKNLTRLCGI